MVRQRVMIVGAGRDQVPLIRRAKEMGFEVLVVSVDGDYPGFSIADKAIKLDIRAKEEIVAVARQEKICGILTDQLDGAVPTVAYVAQEMGLPGIGYDCAVRFTNKYEMRQAAERAGIRMPKYSRASSPHAAHRAAEEVGYPLVVKPVDSAGSRGVARVERPEELAGRYADAVQYSTRREVILEEYCSGREVVVAGLVSEFEVTYLGLADRYYFDALNVFVPKRTLFPSLLDTALAERVRALNTALVESLHPRFGITHSEWLVNEENGEIRLVETAIRGGGVFISSDLVPLAYGVDVEKFLIRMASGQREIKLDLEPAFQRASGYVCFSLPEGTIRCVHGIARVKSLPGVYDAFLDNLRAGQRISPMRDKRDRRGPILISGPDRTALDRTIQRIQETLVVEVETTEGIQGIEW